MGFENVGRVWNPDTLSQYLEGLEKPAWCKAITLHHTGVPSLADRPRGFNINHIRNTRDYYINTPKLRWSTGPHFFIDEDEIFGMCDPRKKGIHAISFNRDSLGLEVLGNYNEEDPESGRGLACWQNAAATVRVLLDWLELEADEETIRFHRDDEETTKTCPGDNVSKEWVLSLIQHGDE